MFALLEHLTTPKQAGSGLAPERGTPAASIDEAIIDEPVSREWTGAGAALVAALRSRAVLSATACRAASQGPGGRGRDHLTDLYDGGADGSAGRPWETSLLAASRSVERLLVDGSAADGRSRWGLRVGSDPDSLLAEAAALEALGEAASELASLLRSDVAAATKGLAGTAGPFRTASAAQHPASGSFAASAASLRGACRMTLGPTPVRSAEAERAGFEAALRQSRPAEPRSRGASAGAGSGGRRLPRSDSGFMDLVPALIGRRRGGADAGGAGPAPRVRVAGGWTIAAPGALPSDDRSLISAAQSRWGAGGGGGSAGDEASLRRAGVVAGLYWGDDEEGWGDVVAGLMDQSSPGPVHEWAAALGPAFERPSALSDRLREWGLRPPSDEDGAAAAAADGRAGSAQADGAGGFAAPHGVAAWAERLGLGPVPPPSSGEAGLGRLPVRWAQRRLATEDGRASLVEALNAQRGAGTKCASRRGLLWLAAVFLGCLDAVGAASADGSSSEGEAEQLVPLGMTFWADSEAGARRWLSAELLAHGAWSSAQFWEACMVVSTSAAVQAAAGPLGWSEMSDDERRGMESREGAAVSGQLCSYAVAMREYRCPRSVARRLMVGLGAGLKGDAREGLELTMQAWLGEGWREAGAGEKGGEGEEEEGGQEGAEEASPAEASEEAVEDVHAAEEDEVGDQGAGRARAAMAHQDESAEQGRGVAGAQGER